MPRRARLLAESGVYHVIVRGVNRDAIFLEDGDYLRFLHTLTQAKQASGCLVLAYCLMNNHAHLLLRTGHESLGEVMKRVGVRYAGWFNHKYGRVGHLFQDRFRSKPVDTDAYLLTLVRYIWQNPVKARLVEDPTVYRWNSCWSGGSPAGLVDADELDALTPPMARAELADPVVDLDIERTARTGRPPRHSHDEVRELIRHCCGAQSPLDFGRLDEATQRRAIRELRTRSVSYESIATATGLSPSTVRRMHIITSEGAAAQDYDAQDYEWKPVRDQPA